MALLFHLCHLLLPSSLPWLPSSDGKKKKTEWDSYLQLHLDCASVQGKTRKNQSPGQSLQELQRASWEAQSSKKSVLGRGNVLTPSSSQIQWLPLFISHNFHSPLPDCFQNIPLRYPTILLKLNTSRSKPFSYLLGLTPFSMYLSLSGVPEFLQATMHKTKWSKDSEIYQSKILNIF